MNTSVSLSAFSGSQAVEGAVIAIGVKEGMDRIPTQDGRRRTIHVAFDDLDAALLAAVGPDMVVAPLIGDGFDCKEVAQTLSRLGYRGKFVGLAPELPRPQLVRSEIAMSCHGMNFELIQV